MLTSVVSIGAAPDPDRDHEGGERARQEQEQLLTPRVTWETFYCQCFSLSLSKCFSCVSQTLPAGQHPGFQIPSVGVVTDGQ